MNNKQPSNQFYPHQNTPMGFSQTAPNNPYNPQPVPKFINISDNTPILTSTIFTPPVGNFAPYAQPQGQQGYSPNQNSNTSYPMPNAEMNSNIYSGQQSMPQYNYPTQNENSDYQGMQETNGPQPTRNHNLMLKNLVTQYADIVFLNFDDNQSGYLDVKEIYPAVCELFVMCGIPNPTYSDVIALMRKFDRDGNGLIDMSEFRKIMLMLLGFDI